jgi:hypothetical protein
VSAIAHLTIKIEIITVALMIIASGKKKQNQIGGEFFPYPSETPIRMERLIYRALAEDLISRSRAQELLGKPLQEFLVIE